MKIQTACYFSAHEFGETVPFVRMTGTELVTGKRRCLNCGKIEHDSESLKLILDGQLMEEIEVAQQALILREALPNQTQKISI